MSLPEKRPPRQQQKQCLRIQHQLRWREENRNALLQPTTGGRDSVDTMSGNGNASGADTTSSPGGGGMRLGQLLRQKRWQRDSRLLQRSADTQGSADNLLADDDIPPPGRICVL